MSSLAAFFWKWLIVKTSRSSGVRVAQRTSQEIGNAIFVLFDMLSNGFVLVGTVEKMYLNRYGEQCRWVGDKESSYTPPARYHIGRFSVQRISGLRAQYNDVVDLIPE